jgi:hypothetical protein
VLTVTETVVPLGVILRHWIQCRQISTTVNMPNLWFDGTLRKAVIISSSSSARNELPRDVNNIAGTAASLTQSSLQYATDGHSSHKIQNQINLQRIAVSPE